MTNVGRGQPVQSSCILIGGPCAIVGLVAAAYHVATMPAGSAAMMSLAFGLATLVSLDRKG